MDLFQVLDFAGVAVFAATGALAASRKQLDIIGFIFLAAIAGIGGGTLRDIILAQSAIFWVETPSYLTVCVGVAFIAYFTAHLFESRYKLLLWLDALGVSAYCVVGASKGFAATGSATVALVTGVLTATCGGILRDLLAGQRSVLLRPEVYVAAALSGSAIYMVLIALALPQLFAVICGFGLAFVIRGGALIYGWSLPTYKSKKGRDADDIV